MIEVEAKARILHPEKIRILVQKMAHYKGKERKNDDYYTLENVSHYPMKSLRVRKKGKVHIVNFKTRMKDSPDVDIKNETEFYIEDIDGFLKLLDEFGFKKWVTKEKYTEIYEIKKNFHIELNHLKNLGWFVEVEYLCAKKDVAKARTEVMRIMKQLNIDKKDIVHPGYTKLLWDKR
jgi:predicted adenylyl cyclase CyaB